MFTRYSTLVEIRHHYGKAKPAEKGQIIGFIRSNTEGHLGPYGVWSLAHATHLGTGREFLTVSLQLTGKGITAEQMREVVGLPKLKQAVETPSTRKKLMKGARSV